MKILMLGIPGTALKRPVDWALQYDHQVWYVGEYDFYQKDPPTNYRFIPSVLNKVKQEQKLVNELTETKKENLRPLQVAQLHQIVTEFKPHIIHAHGFCYELECCVQANIHPLVFSIWGFFILEPKIFDAYDEFYPKLYSVIKASDAVIVESPFLREQCQALLQPDQKIALIPLGTDTKHFRPYTGENINKAKQLLRFPTQAKVLLSPRGWSRIYCQHEILEAFTIAKPQLVYPTILVFILLGRSSIKEQKSYYEYLRKRVEDLGLSKQIYLIPQFSYEMMPFVYSLSDAIINFPLIDAFPSTLIEASACAKPIITAQLPSYQSTFVEEFCTLVPPHDIASLATAIVKIVNQPEVERREKLALLRQTIIEQYDERIMQQRLFTLYQELASVNN